MIKLFYKYSDWLILWFLLYKFKIINYNPKLSLIFALLANFQTSILLLVKSKKLEFKQLITFILYFLSKIIMLLMLLNDKFDIIANIIVFLIYTLWIYKIHNVNYFENIIKMCTKNKKEEKEQIIKTSIIKMKELNNNNLEQLEEIRNKFKTKMLESNYNIDKIDKIYQKYNKKLNKINIILDDYLTEI